MHNCYTSLINLGESSLAHFLICIAVALFFLFIIKVHLLIVHFFGNLYLTFKIRLDRHTTILILLPLLWWYVNTCEFITTYNCELITNKVIAMYDNNQDILSHHNQIRDLWTICIPIYISPSYVKEMASVKTKYYKYFIPN